MELYKIFALLVLQCVQLKLGLNAPCGNLHSINSTECGKHKQDTSARIVSRPNRKKQGSLLASLLGEDVDVLFGDQEIVFPDSYELLFKPITPIERAPICEDGLSLCEHVASYPYKRVRETLRKIQQHKEFFGVDEVLVTDVKNRVGEVGEGVDENFICGSIETTIFPKAGKNKSNKWKYIINQGETEGYIQGIRIEKCAQFNGPCNLVSDAPVGYVASCKQKYVLRRLLSLSDNGQPAPDSFQIPSACCCAFKKDFNFLTSFGRSVTPSSRLRR